jgi:hypothetical protein
MSISEALAINAANPDAHCYSILGSLSDSDKVDGRFTFKWVSVSML